MAPDRDALAADAARSDPSTLSGDVTLGEGILNNEIYVGRRIFNRRRWVEVPNERRCFPRKPRLNPEAEWIVRDEPALRIIDQLLWDAVKVRQARDEKFGLTANPLSGAKRPAHLLSGLVACGACGSPVLATGAGRWRCKGHRTGACTNGSVTTSELENRAFAGIRGKLLTPEAVSQFAAAFQRELKEAHRTDNAERARNEIELTEPRARIAKLVTRTEEDDDGPRSLSVRLKELEATEQALEATLATLATLAERQVVRLPANYEALYLRAIADLDQHLATERQRVSHSITYREDRGAAGRRARRQAPTDAAARRPVSDAGGSDLRRPRRNKAPSG